ncbi:hypothetical protein SKB0120_15350 [Moraxella osloensis]
MGSVAKVLVSVAKVLGSEESIRLSVASKPYRIDLIYQFFVLPKALNRFTLANDMGVTLFD